MTVPDRYGVMGYPVSHSRSPVIHRLFALQTGQDIQYELLQVTPENLETAIRQFQRTGGKGLNITVPHKTAVVRLVDQLSERAVTAGAANTLTFRNGQIYGDNTDGIGLLRDLAVNLGLTIDSGTAEGITAAELEVTDADNVASEIVYTLTGTPETGFLRLGNVVLAASDTFTQADIDNGLLSFEHDENSIDQGTQWVVFEPNADELWARVRRSIGNFLTTVWRNGALEGTTPEQAFFVKCDRTTMTRDDIDNGRLICVIGVAPVKPAEFVIIRIGQWLGGSAVQEL